MHEARINLSGNAAGNGISMRCALISSFASPVSFKYGGFLRHVHRRTDSRCHNRLTLKGGF